MSDLSAWPTEDEVLERFSAKERLAVRRMLAAIEREAAAKALDDAAYEIFVSPAEIDPGKRVAFHRGADAVYDALRARAEAYLREETE